MSIPQIGARDERTILLVAPDEALMDRARVMGVNCVVVDKPEKLRTSITERSAVALGVDYENPQLVVDLVRALASRLPIHGTFSFAERGLLAVAHINEALGLPGATVRSVELTRDKAKMREAVRHVQDFESEVVSKREAATDFGDRVGWPIIIKPIDGVGSRGVERIESAADLDRFDWSGQPCLVERYVSGQVVSVDAFSFDGRHVLYAINEEFPLADRGPPGSNPLIHRAHMIPAAISERAVAALEALLPKVLDALGLRDGPSHTEFIISDHSAWLVECHTRVGGAFIPEMFQRCTGVDLLSMAIAWPLGLLPEPPKPVWTRGACFQIFLPEAGRVDRIAGVESSVDLPDVAVVSLRIKPGDIVPPLRGASDNVGHVIAVAPTGREAFEACERVKAHVQISVQRDA